MAFKTGVCIFVLFAGCAEEGFNESERFEGFVEADDEFRRRALFRLGKFLFFDQELSGNRNTSCATCHFPFLTTAEPLPLSIGQGGQGVGPSRRKASGVVLPRNTTDLFDRNALESTALFWDGRIELVEGRIVAPISLPSGIDSLLAAQALFPLLDRDEMRGYPGDIAADGRLNELAELSDDAPEAIWNAIVTRLWAIDEYRELFEIAFPGESPRIELVARALARFQETMWQREHNSRFDQPEDVALSDEEIRGKNLFFGDAGCARCHSGKLLSDQRFYNIAVPQLGPGKDPQTGLDEGRFWVTGNPADRFSFRTPSLRNIRLTPPYMHNGAYATLEDVIFHHLHPIEALRTYDGSSLPPSLREEIHDEESVLEDILMTFDDPRPLRHLSEQEIDDLIAFLETLDDQIELQKGPEHGVPDSVPSGLMVDRWPGGPHPYR